MAESKQVQQEMISSADLEATASHQSGHLNEKVALDGDEALKILHTHFEPYTPEEEKKVLRKIDMRMCLLMLVIK